VLVSPLAHLDRFSRGVRIVPDAMLALQLAQALFGNFVPVTVLLARLDNRCDGKNAKAGWMKHLTRLKPRDRTELLC
jgi:hypothetical protein